MDDLLREFVTGTNESPNVVDVEFVRFEQDSNNAKIVGNGGRRRLRVRHRPQRDRGMTVPNPQHWMEWLLSQNSEEE
jgi:hypothetical protein